MSQDATYGHVSFKSAVFVFIASFLLYCRSMGFGFVMDDVFQILENPAITDLSNLPRFFSTPVWAMLGDKPTGNIFYRPLMYALFSIDYALFGLKPWGYHLVSILVHSMNAVLVFFVADRAVKARFESFSVFPVMAALAFSAHAVNSEAASWLGATPELLFTFFLLAALLLHVAASSLAGRGLAAIALLLSLLSKETAIVFLPLALAYDTLLADKRPGKALLGQVPYVVAAIIYAGLRQNALSGWQKTNLLDMSTYEFVTNAFVIFRHNIFKLLVPANMNALYDIDPLLTMLTGKAVLSIIVTVAFFALFVAVRKNRVLFFSLLWVLLPLLPTLFAQKLSTRGYADRYLYLSTIGFGLMVAYIADVLIRRYGVVKTVVYAFVAAFILVHSGAAFARAGVWKDGLSLWSDVVEKSPAQPNARYNLAWHLERAGDAEGAIREYKMAVRLAPGLGADALLNMAGIYEKTNRPNEALDAYRALALLQGDPLKRGAIFLRAGEMLAGFGDVDGARKAYEEALQNLPGNEAVSAKLKSLDR